MEMQGELEKEKELLLGGKEERRKGEAHPHSHPASEPGPEAGTLALRTDKSSNPRSEGRDQGRIVLIWTAMQKH